MIQLGRQGLMKAASEAELDGLRAAYEQNNYVILPSLIEPDLFERLVVAVESARFVSRVHEGVGVEFCMANPALRTTLVFLASNPAFLRIVERITGSPQLGSFDGRVYRMTASDGHYDSWHSDVCDGRAAAMSLNFTRERFRGGALQMKHRHSDNILCEIHNTGFGDALVFRVSNKLLHRIQSVEGDVPKTAFAGWFCEGPDWLAGLQKSVSTTERT